MNTIPDGKKIVLFDGVCNLCNKAVQKILLADSTDHFRLTSLDSDKGKEILKYLGIDRTKIDSLVLWEPGEAYYIESQAILRIGAILGGKYGILSSVLSIFPKGLADQVYRYVAKNRYQWYGKQESCLVPQKEWENKFL